MPGVTPHAAIHSDKDRAITFGGFSDKRARAISDDGVALGISIPVRSQESQDSQEDEVQPVLYGFPYHECDFGRLPPQNTYSDQVEHNLLKPM